MFPFTERLVLDRDLRVHFEDVLTHIGPQLTNERRHTIERVVQGRCYNSVLVLEDVYDRGNISAVLRSSEAMGFGQAHVIELGEKFKESQRTTAGADKWVEIKKWKSTAACVEQLKREGKKIVVTHLDSTSIPIDDFDFSQPNALVLGNEKNGVSKEMIEAADARVILPMKGFVQSFNISVAGALSLWHIMKDREKKKGHADLDETQKKILTALYYLRTQDSAEKTLRELSARGLLSKDRGE